jgi:hypothetical protein
MLEHEAQGTPHHPREVQIVLGRVALRLSAQLSIQPDCFPVIKIGSHARYPMASDK